MEYRQSKFVKIWPIYWFSWCRMKFTPEIQENNKIPNSLAQTYSMGPIFQSHDPNSTKIFCSYGWCDLWSFHMWFKMLLVAYFRSYIERNLQKRARNWILYLEPMLLIFESKVALCLQNGKQNGFFLLKLEWWQNFVSLTWQPQQVPLIKTFVLKIKIVLVTVCTSVCHETQLYVTLSVCRL